MSRTQLKAALRSDRAARLGRTSLLVAGIVAAGATGAFAQTGTGVDTTTLTAAPFSGTITQTNGFINTMIADYGVPSIIASLALSGWALVRHLAKSAFH